MIIENQLRESLQEKGNSFMPPPELKTKIISNIETANGKLRKRLAAGILAATLLIPTGVFASQSFLADDIYGSFENLKKHIFKATMDGYMLLSAKLSQAKGELNTEEYKEFKELLNVVTSSKLQYGDPYGNIDYSQIPSEELVQIKQALMGVQPFFDKLNGLKSSKEILSSEEYTAYIEALMTYEEVLVKSNIDPSEGPIDIEMIPSDLQAEFIKAKDFMSYVDKKQVQ
ncbi:DUF3600 domain-containing protein [Bacillus sp. JJ1503]|uniref:DUF3600 domain-containing protein n=1 Tax=unclassified Bacillus (in: firmicutes) TaxID=185979 RepID=UPI002FFF8F47